MGFENKLDMSLSHKAPWQDFGGGSPTVSDHATLIEYEILQN